MSPRLVQFTCALPASEIVLTRQMLLVHTDGHSQRFGLVGEIDNGSFCKRCIEPAHAKLGIIEGECASRRIGKPDTQGIKSEMRSCSSGHERQLSGSLDNGYRPRFPILSNNRCRAVVHSAAFRKKANSKQ